MDTEGREDWNKDVDYLVCWFCIHLTKYFMKFTVFIT